MIVQKDPSIIPDDGNIPFGTHSLARLASEAGFLLSNGESKYINRLTDYLVWGRYPTTKNPSKYIDCFEDRERFHPDVFFPLEEFFNPVMDIIKRAEEKYISKQKT